VRALPLEGALPLRRPELLRHLVDELEHLVHELVERVGHVLALVAVLLALPAEERDLLAEALELLFARVERGPEPLILLDEGGDEANEVLAVLDPLLHLGARLGPRGPFHAVRHRSRLPLWSDCVTC